VDDKPLVVACIPDYNEERGMGGVVVRAKREPHCPGGDEREQDAKWVQGALRALEIFVTLELDRR
jgi:hypothetical protein